MFLVFDEVESTMVTAKAYALEGSLQRFAIWARKQTAGRGRQGRRWLSPEGGLYLSLVSPALVEPPLYGVLAAIEIAWFFRAQGFEIALKWPNDLIVEGRALEEPEDKDRKVGGIVAELLLDGFSVPRVVVGIGVNVRTSVVLPASAPRVESSSPVCYLDALESPSQPPPSPAALEPLSLVEWRGRDLDPEVLGRQLAEVCFAAYRRMESGRRKVGSDGVGEASTAFVREMQERWCAVASTLGQRVCLFLPSGDKLEGIAAAITEDFSLLLETDDGKRHAIRVGDCLHLRPA